MTTFVQLMSTASEVYYSDMRYQMRVSSVDSDAYEKGLQIAGLDGAQEVEIVRQAMVEADGALIPYTEEYLDQASAQVRAAPVLPLVSPGRA